jgi:hypothetical protein
VELQFWLVEFQKWLLKSVALIVRCCYDCCINQEGFTMIVTKQVPTQQFLENYTGNEIFFYYGAFTKIEDDGLCYASFIHDFVDSETVWSDLSTKEFVIVVIDSTCCVIGMTLDQVNGHNKEGIATKHCNVDGAITSSVVPKFWKEVV